MVVGLFFNRNQLALGENLANGHIRALVEKLCGWKAQHAVVLDHDQHAVLGPAHTIRHFEVKGRRKCLDLTCHAFAVAVCHGPDRGFSGADKQHVGGWRDSHVARIGHHGIQFNFEARRQLDLFEVGAQSVGFAAILRHGWNVQVSAGDLHLLQVGNIVFWHLRSCAKGYPRGNHGKQ